MKSSISLLTAAVLIAGALLATACAKAEEPRLPPLGLAEAAPESLWRRISEESPYKTYAYWPGHEGVREGQAPHGPYHRIYVNATLLAALPSPSSTAPEGAIIVKENMNADHVVTGLTVMAKIKGFNPERGDWYWARYDLQGKASASGAVNGCINCHAGMRDNDYVIVRRLDAAAP